MWCLLKAVRIDSYGEQYLFATEVSLGTHISLKKTPNTKDNSLLL